MSFARRAYYSELIKHDHYVYRVYAEDVLLYVGVTINPPGRFAKHKYQKPWWKQVTDIQLERFTSREEALAAERDAIIHEYPIHNVARPKEAPTCG